MVFRPGFGAMIVPNRHLMTGDAASAFQDIELL